MTVKKFEKLNDDFAKLCDGSDMRAGFAFFIGKGDKAAVVFKDIADDELMHMMATLTNRIAKKHNLTNEQVLEALADGLAESAPN